MSNPSNPSRSKDHEGAHGLVHKMDIEELNEQLAEEKENLNAEIEALKKAVRQKDETISIFREDQYQKSRFITEIRYQVDKLKTIVDEKQNLISRLLLERENLKASISYRCGFFITRPVRMLMNGFPGLFLKNKSAAAPKTRRIDKLSKEAQGLFEQINLFSHEVNVLEHPVVFNAEFYANYYSDLKVFNGDSKKLKAHWIRFGVKEGRTASPLYNPIYYARITGFKIGDMSYEEMLMKWFRDLKRSKSVCPSFDEKFYESKYEDLETYRAGQNLRQAIHYITYGIKEGRMGSPYFDPDFYLNSNEDIVKLSKSNYLLALIQWLKFGVSEGRVASPVFSRNYISNLSKNSKREVGDLSILAEWVLKMNAKPVKDLVQTPNGIDYKKLFDVKRPLYDRYYQYWKIGEFKATDKKEIHRELGFTGYSGMKETVIVVAHRAGKFLYGGERSFIDIINNIDKEKYNVVCLLPQYNKDFVQILKIHCFEVITFEYGWWKVGEEYSLETINVFRTIYREYHADLIHLNTIMLMEAVAAAKMEAIPSIVHVRELISKDLPLQNVLNGTDKEIRDIVLMESDHILANSETTSEEFNKDEKGMVVYNTVADDLFDLENEFSDHLKFGIISSNIKKKGILDFAELAEEVYKKNQNIEFHIIGEETSLVIEIKAKIEAQNLKANLIFPGYQESNVEAVRLVNVIVNFSHFAESFGRTIAEGMAAGRPVIGYDYGALPEWIDHNENGYIIAYKKPLDAVKYVLEIDEERMKKLGEMGRKKAKRLFSYDVYKEGLNASYKTVLDKNTLTDRSFSFDTVLYGHELKKLKLAYFVWHFPVPSETFVLSELKYLQANGYDVKVYCYASPYKEFVPDFPIEYENVRNIDELKQKMVADNINIVHAHFAYPTVTRFVWPACHDLKIPFTFIAHAQDIFRYENMTENRIIEIVNDEMCLKMFTLGRFHRNFLIKHGVPAEKIIINPQVIDNSSFTPINKKELNGSICAIGRFVEKKGFDLLIRAAAYLESLGIELYIYGYGDLEEDYQQLIAQLQVSNVHLAGKLNSSEEVRNMYARHDLLVQPSIVAANGDMDGIPTVLVEAMSVGLPVMTTEVASISELVQDDVNGIILNSTNPEYISHKITEFYSMPFAKIQSLIVNGKRQVERIYNINRAMMMLNDVWTGLKIDIILVTYINEKYPNLVELREVVDRLYKFTHLPFNLIIVDNGSDKMAVEYMQDLEKTRPNIKLILNDENLFVGPGTNVGFDHGDSDFMFYVCAVEGFALRNGWETEAIREFRAKPEIGIVGSTGYSPTYLKGSDFPSGIKLFDKFRNADFALDNPDRIFYHIQGGFMGFRREMVDSIGGFNTATPHSYTDVEMSYYAESEGWKLYDIPAYLALFEKTRPGILSRITEHTRFTHPGLLPISPLLNDVAGKKVHLCNICEWHGKAYLDDDTCPSCGSIPTTRSIFRYFASSILSYRRLPAIYVNPHTEILEKYWKKSFQGRTPSFDFLMDEINRTGKIDNRTGGMSVILLNMQSLDSIPEKFIEEIHRIISDDGQLIIWTNYLKDSFLKNEHSAREIDVEASKYLRNFMSKFDIIEEVLYDSFVVKYDFRKLIVMRKK